MTPGDFAGFDSLESEPWHWYVLIGYPVLSLFGIVALGRLTDGGSVLASSLGSVALLIILTALGAVTLPAIWRDVEFVRSASDEWCPDHHLYVGTAVGIPLLLGVIGGLSAGLSVAIALVVLAFLVSTIAVCLVYLYNRSRAIGLTAR